MGIRRPARAGAFLQLTASVVLAGATLVAISQHVPGPSTASATPATAVARPKSTPALINAAQQAGTISTAQARRYLAYAVAAPDWLPTEYRSTARWDATTVLLDLDRKRAELPSDVESLLHPAPQPDNVAMRQAARGDYTAAALQPPDGVSRACSTFTAAKPNIYTTTNFYIEFDQTQLSGLTIDQYANTLEANRTKEVTTFGWSAPPVNLADPAPGSRYHVRLEDLGPGELGFVTSGGRHGGSVGNNPNTAWTEPDALASCMVLHAKFDDYSGPGQSALQILDGTTAHEFAHAIHFGMGIATGPNAVDSSWIEAMATWAEEDVAPTSDTALLTLYPEFNETLGEHTGDPYALWLAFRGLTELYGAGVAGGSEQVIQDLTEIVAQHGVNANGKLQMGALAQAIANKGNTLSQMFHAYGVASKFLVGCGSASLPLCYADGAAYRSVVGSVPAVHGTIGAVGNTFSGSIDDEFAVNWIQLPAATGDLSITITNNAPSGQGRLNATAICLGPGGVLMEASGLPAATTAPAPGSFFPQLATGITGGNNAVIGPYQYSTQCQNPRILVVTNDATGGLNPSSVASRPYTVQVATHTTTSSTSSSSTSTTSSTSSTSTSSTTVPTTPTTRPPLVDPAAAAYRLVASDGGLFSFGAPFHGSLGGVRLNQPIVGAESTPSGGGYWMVASDGGVFSFGDALFRGSTGNIRLNKPIVGMAATPSGAGYWLVASDGGIFSFGDATYFGSLGGLTLNKPIVAMAAHPSGQGYLLFASDGGVFAFGVSGFRGSLGHLTLNSPIVGAAPTVSGAGYWMVARDGGTFAFGDAGFLGSVPNASNIAGLLTTPSGLGYWLYGSDGAVYAFGNAPYRGSTSSIRLNKPIVTAM